MTLHIALLRGINVGGSHLLPMKELVTILGRLGCEDVKTYIQSGNVVLRHASDAAPLAVEIRDAIEAAKGFAPQVFLITAADLVDAAAANPFPDAEDDPSKLHLAFLASDPQQPDLPAIDALRTRGERCELVGRVFYLHAPEGIGRSKLAAKAERLFGVPTTGRNWRTVQRLLALAAAEG